MWRGLFGWFRVLALIVMCELLCFVMMVMCCCVEFCCVVALYGMCLFGSICMCLLVCSALCCRVLCMNVAMNLHVCISENMVFVWFLLSCFCIIGGICLICGMCVCWFCWFVRCFCAILWRGGL